MFSVEINAKNLEEITVPVPVTLPKCAWLIITARANALHGGDIVACCQDLMERGLAAEIKVIGVGVRPTDVPAPNAPGGNA